MWFYEYLQYVSWLPIAEIFFDLKKSPIKFVVYVCLLIVSSAAVKYFVTDFPIRWDTWYYFLPIILAPFIAALLPSFDLKLNDHLENHDDSEVID